MTTKTKTKTTTNIKPHISLTPEEITNYVIELKTKLSYQKITVRTIHIVLQTAMELVDKIICSGTDKKKYVLLIVREVVKELAEDEIEERIILEIIDNKLLENTMDIIILASKGQLNLNNKKTQQKLLSCSKTAIKIIIDIVMYIINSNKKTKPSKTKKEYSNEPMLIIDILENNPVKEEPVKDEEPVKEEPVKEEPVKDEPVKEDPVKEEPVKEDPVKEEPVKEEPVKEEPVKEEPVKEDEPVKEEPVKEEPVKEEPVKEEPIKEEHVKEDEPIE
jgi:hypothetical protein